MAEFEESVKNRTDEPTISADTEPTMYERMSAQPWFDWAVRIILAVIVILIIVFGGRWIHHRLENRNKPVNVPTAVNQTPSSPNRSATGTGSSSNAGTGTGSGTKQNSSQSPSSGSTATGPSLKSGQQLSNTGPGNVVAVFLASGFAAAGLHYVYANRRNS